MRKTKLVVALVLVASLASKLASQDFDASKELEKLFGPAGSNNAPAPVAPLTPPTIPRTTNPIGSPPPANPPSTNTPVAPSTQFSPSSATTDGNVVTLKNCAVVPLPEPVVAASEAGKLMFSPALGQEVKEEEVVAKTDDTMARYQQRIAFFAYEAEKSKLESDIQERYAAKQSEVAEASYRDAKAANEEIRNAVSPNMLRQRKFEWEGAILGIEKAQFDMQVTRAGAEVKLAEYRASDAAVKRHEIQSPINGVVTEVLKTKGEWVTQGEPIAKLIQLDRVRVFGNLPIGIASPGRLKGANVTVKVPVARGRDGKPTQFESVQAKIIHVGAKVSGRDDYEVYAEVQNTANNDFWPGTPNITMEIQLP